MRTQIDPFQSERVAPHYHVDGHATCPMCEQDIPPEKLEEVGGRIAARQKEQEQSIRTLLETRFETERAQAEAKALAKLEEERQRSAARLEAVREETRKAAETAAKAQQEEMQRAQAERQSQLQAQLDQSENARAAAEGEHAALTARIGQLRQESAEAIEAIKVQTAAQVESLRATANQEAEAAVAGHLDAVRLNHAKQTITLQQQIEEADRARALLETQLKEGVEAKTAEIERIKNEAALDQTRIKQEATEAAQLAASQHAADKEQAVTDAMTRATAAEA